MYIVISVQYAVVDAGYNVRPEALLAVKLAHCAERNTVMSVKAAYYCCSADIYGDSIAFGWHHGVVYAQFSYPARKYLLSCPLGECYKDISHRFCKTGHAHTGSPFAVA